MQISLRRLPPSSALFSDYLDNGPNVRPFYSQEYSLDAIEKFAKKRSRPSAEHMERLCSVLDEQQKLFGSGSSGVENLASGAVAVITGQQPGLFTGPHLSILKALTAVQLARHLEKSGIRATPVFWIASEDHDHDEIETTWVLNRESGLCRARVDLSDSVPSPVGWVQYRDDIRQVVSDCMSCLPNSGYAEEVLGMLESCYQPGRSPVESFGRMMAKLFAGTPLTLVDPLHPELKRLTQPGLSEAVRRNDEIRRAVLARGAALQQAGYHQQVKVDEDFTGLFAYRGRAREVLKPKEIASNLVLSPNALLRPVIQDQLFPTAVYIGGPAEVAYFAQAAPVYETLGCPMPPIFPRITATIVEPRIHRFMEKSGIAFTDIFEGMDFLKRKSVSAVQDVDAFSRVRKQIETELQSLRSLLTDMDATLQGALDTSQRKAIYQVESLRTRYINAAARRDETMARHLLGIGNSLYPDKKLQERVLNVTSFLSRYGMDWVRRLDDTLSLETSRHQVIEI